MVNMEGLQRALYKDVYKLFKHIKDNAETLHIAPTYPKTYEEAISGLSCGVKRDIVVGEIEGTVDGLESVIEGFGPSGIITKTSQVWYFYILGGESVKEVLLTGGLDKRRYVRAGDRFGLSDIRFNFSFGIIPYGAFPRLTNYTNPQGE